MPSKFDILEVGKSKEVENPKGLHSMTFPYVKTCHYFVFETMNQKLNFLKFRRPNTCHIRTFKIRKA